MPLWMPQDGSVCLSTVACERWHHRDHQHQHQHHQPQRQGWMCQMERHAGESLQTWQWRKQWKNTMSSAWMKSPTHWHWMPPADPQATPLRFPCHALPAMHAVPLCLVCHGCAQQQHLHSAARCSPALLLWMRRWWMTMKKRLWWSSWCQRDGCHCLPHLVACLQALPKATSSPWMQATP